MDSITQAVLGAAVGEAVLGKKLGNRAILWGAIAGTIPDLDVVSKLFITEPLYGLMYHRGLSHSILFTVLSPFLFAWLAHKYYERGLHRNQIVQTLASTVWLLLPILLVGAISLVLGVGGLGFAVGGAVVALSVFRLYKYSLPVARHNADTLHYTTTYKEWYVMFFWGILTHWFIDACTAYGTQIFEPFSSYRIAFNNIFIVDPAYTVPFLLCLPIVYFCKDVTKRRFWNNVGLGLSTGYMALTFVIKTHVNSVTEQSLQTHHIEYDSYMTTPAPLTTIMWQSIAEDSNNFYCGMYSLLDKRSTIEYISIPKNHELIEPYKTNEFVKILLWFAQGYYVIQPSDDGTLMFYNMRFGVTYSSADSKEYVFVMGYRIRDDNGTIRITEERGGVRRLDMKQAWSAFVERLKGV